MAGKEKKAAVVRQLNKEEAPTNCVSVPKKRGRKTNAERAALPQQPARLPMKRTPRRKPIPPPEDQKQLTPRSRKPFLEKELEDILENATGRNTPLDDRSSLFLPKSRREPDDDTLSVRSLSTFLRGRRVADREIEDDVLSLRSVKLRKEDDDTMSVRSLPGKPKGKPKTSGVAVKTKVKTLRTKKTPATNSATTTKKKPTKTKETIKKPTKKPLRLQNKISSKRSNLLIKKKVRNAKIAVKRIYKKKAALKENADVLSAEVPSPLVKSEPADQLPVKVEIKHEVTSPEVETPTLPVPVRNGDVLSPLPVTDAAGGKAVRRRLVRGPPVAGTASAPAPNGVPNRRKRRWENKILFDTERSKEDSSVIIVQPRLGPKVARRSAPAEMKPAVVVVPASSASQSASTSSLSTPYYIQTVPNFNALKSQPTAQGDWLVTPSGVVLIQAVPTGTTVSECVDGSGPAVSLGTVGTMSASEPSPQSSPLSATPPTTVSSAVTSLVSSAESTPICAVAPSPTLSGTAVAPSPSPSGVPVADSMLSEKAREAEPAHAVSVPRIPVAKNVHELLVLKSQLDEGESSTPCKEKRKPELPFKQNRIGGAERRASHDGSFGPLPSRQVRRTGSCERLNARSPRAILQLGSEPLQLADAVCPFETDSSFSLQVTLALPPTSDPPPSPEPVPDPSLTGTPSPLSTASQDKAQVINSRPESPQEPKPSLESETVTETVNGHEGSNSPTISPETIIIPVKELKADGEEVKPMPGLNDLTPLKTAGRTKKYSRSLDSRQTLLSGVRRRSNPEPRVINIVTLEDGSRRGQTLAEELRNECSAVADSSETTEMVDVPYVNPLITQCQNKPLIEETPEDLAKKETVLSALGLQSLRAAAELARRKASMAAEAANQVSAAAASNNYRGTLKTVIKIQRPEKKGNGRMIYKASCSSEPGPDCPTQPAPPDIDENHQGNPSPGSKESQESGDEDGKNGNGKAKALVIPEKASSFSIHPHRMCSDVCTYCFGKFGLLDTPCHIAQLKDGDKRRNILDIETHLTLDSCLCDACFRHVDKKSNGQPSTERKPGKRKLMVQKQQRCCVESCELDAQHSVKRKSLLKLKKSLGKKLILDQMKMEKLQPTHLVTLCNRHIYWVDYFMSCGICNKRLSNVHMYRVGPDVLELNGVLGVDGIPTVLTEKRFLCKLCQFYSSIRLKHKDPTEMTSSQRQFYHSCRRRILQCHGIDVPDSEAEIDGPSLAAGETTEKKAKSKKLKPSSTVTNGVATTPKSSEDLSDLRASFKPHQEPVTGFHKCTTTLQFTKETKDLFYKLQRPYGNHSSFFRHLIMLEKYFRSGDLVLSRKPDARAAKYINGVHNRLRSYDGVPQVSMRPFTLTPVPATTSSAASSSSSSSSSSSTVTTTATPPAPSIPSISSLSVTCHPAPAAPPPPVIQPTTTSPNHLTQLQSTVHNIGIKPDISISSIGSEPRKLTPKIQENLRALANRAGKPGGQTRAVILNRTVGGQKQSLVQVTTGGKTIHLTLSQFRRIQQMQIKKKQYLEQAKAAKTSKSKANGPSTEAAFPHIPKALSVSLTNVPAVDLTSSPPPTTSVSATRSE